jgi:hypothetical protein
MPADRSCHTIKQECGKKLEPFLEPFGRIASWKFVLVIMEQLEAC